MTFAGQCRRSPGNRGYAIHFSPGLAPRVVELPEHGTTVLMTSLRDALVTGYAGVIIGSNEMGAEARGTVDAGNFYDDEAGPTGGSGLVVGGQVISGDVAREIRVMGGEYNSVRDLDGTDAKG